MNAMVMMPTKLRTTIVDPYFYSEQVLCMITDVRTSHTEFYVFFIVNGPYLLPDPVGPRRTVTTPQAASPHTWQAATRQSHVSQHRPQRATCWKQRTCLSQPAACLNGIGVDHVSRTHFESEHVRVRTRHMVQNHTQKARAQHQSESHIRNSNLGATLELTSERTVLPAAPLPGMVNVTSLHARLTWLTGSRLPTLSLGIDGCSASSLAAALPSTVRWAAATEGSAKGRSHHGSSLVKDPDPPRHSFDSGMYTWLFRTHLTGHHSTSASLVP